MYISFSRWSLFINWPIHMLCQVLRKHPAQGLLSICLPVPEEQKKYGNPSPKSMEIQVQNVGPAPTRTWASLCPIVQSDKSIKENRLTKANQSHRVGPPANILILAARSLPAKTPGSCSNIWCLKRLTLIIHLYLTQPRFLDKCSYKGIRNGQTRENRHAHLPLKAVYEGNQASLGQAKGQAEPQGADHLRFI